MHLGKTLQDVFAKMVNSIWLDCFEEKCCSSDHLWRVFCVQNYAYIREDHYRQLFIKKEHE